MLVPIPGQTGHLLGDQNIVLLVMFLLFQCLLYTPPLQIDHVCGVSRWSQLSCTRDIVCMAISLSCLLLHCIWRCYSCSMPNQWQLNTLLFCCYIARRIEAARWKIRTSQSWPTCLVWVPGPPHWMLSENCKCIPSCSSLSYAGQSLLIFFENICYEFITMK